MKSAATAKAETALILDAVDIEIEKLQAQEKIGAAIKEGFYQASVVFKEPLKARALANFFKALGYGVDNQIWGSSGQSILWISWS